MFFVLSSSDEFNSLFQYEYIVICEEKNGILGAIIELVLF